MISNKLSHLILLYSNYVELIYLTRTHSYYLCMHDHANILRLYVLFGYVHVSDD